MADRKSLEPWLLDSVDFRDYQVDGVRFMVKRQNALQADEMGLGKTLQSIATFSTDLKMNWGGNETLLVVAPVTLKRNWANELQKFTRIPFTVLGEGIGPSGKRVKLGQRERFMQIGEFIFQKGPRVLICNYEQVAPHLEELNAVGFHMAVFDEAHYLGNSDSQRTQACLHIKARRKIPMSGTPVTHHVPNLWALLSMVYKGTPPFNTFINRHAVYGGFKNKQIVGIKRKDDIHEILGGLMIRRLKEDVLNLKEPHIIQVPVELTDQQQKLYDEVVNDLQLTTASDPENPMEVENGLVKSLRLKQICGTTFEFTGEDHSNKLTRAVDDTQELIANGHRLVVFTQFRMMNDRFAARVRQANPHIPVWQLHGDVDKGDRVDMVEEWGRHPQPGVLVAAVQVGAIGLNMTAGRHCLFLDKTYTPALNKQAIDRMHRLGQDESQPVTVFEYITAGTVEERVEEICDTKIGVADELIEEANADWKSRLYAELYGKKPKPPVASQGQMSISDIANTLPG